MPIRYALDTNIISEPSRPNPNPRVVELLNERIGQVAIPSPAWYELVFGLERLPQGKKRVFVAGYLAEVLVRSIPILPYTQEAAEWHAGEQARLFRLGETRPYVDGMIAAVAVANDLILVTRNVDDYAGFEGLHLENWFEM
jgi:tRNA(fMet)-specific endonuclease VapC